MAKFVVDGAVYDTETATAILEYRKSYPSSLTIMGHTIYNRQDTTLYKTIKGNWFSASKNNLGQLQAYKETPETVKSLFQALDAVDLYAEHFEPLPLG